MFRRALLASLLSLVFACPAHAALTVTGTQVRSPRLTEYTATSDALGGTTRIRVLTPAPYADGRRYPVLLLLHGCCDDYRSWVDKGRAEQLTAPYPLIVVMPDGGPSGWYSDPYAGGTPKYETYAFDELLPWIDTTFATTGGRAVAGLSMGGFGALKYAARHPGVFEAAASFSGVVDNASFADAGWANLIPESVWSADRARWREHNPLDLADRLRGLKLLELRTGNGEPGPLDTRTSRDALEAEVGRENDALHARLDQLGIPHVYDDYGPGVHDWPYWARDLERTLVNLRAVFPETQTGTVEGTVPSTLVLTLGGAASFGAFAPGVARTYTATAAASVTSTAGDATLSVSDPGHLRNGAFELPQPLQVELSKASWTGPVTADPVTIAFRQAIGATDPLRTGTNSRRVTFTLSTTAP
jgi:S-formylglutathione hydrolase FrmB